MKVIIFYHEIQRELQNAYLLKAELQRRGHEVYVYHYDYIIKSKRVLYFTPDIVITHCLHDPKAVEYVTRTFNSKITRIVNLQYEQVMSNMWDKATYQIPQGIEKNAIHLCWGEMGKNRFISNGISEENVKVVGCLNVDMCSEKFRRIYKNKEQMASDYNLDKSKEWILFLSSFTLAQVKKSQQKGMGIRVGEAKATEFCEISTESRRIILEWIEEYIGNNDCEFIYRPHPYEKRKLNNFDALDQLETKSERFHVIKEDSVRSWINVCDKINTWISTSIIDAYFMNKNCAILRPVNIPEYLDHELMMNSNKITKYEEFYNYNKFDCNMEFTLDKKIIDGYYSVDKNKYAYERICDLLEKIYKDNLIMKLYQ